MGESIAEGTITKWMKNLGDKVQRDEPLFEISTDKVDAEIPSPAAGFLKEIRVQAGVTVAINTVVGIIAAEAEVAAATPPVAVAPPPPPPAPASVTPLPPAPPLVVAPAPPPLVVSPPPPAPPPVVAPPPQRLVVAPPPPPLVVAPAAPVVAPPSPPVALAPTPVAAGHAPVAPLPVTAAPAKPEAELTADELRQARSSPVVRKIAAEHHVDIREVPGTGISGRVTRQDILTHIEGRGAEVPATPAARIEPAATPFVAAKAPGERVEVVPMSPIRRKTAEHMVLSRRISAHVSTVWEIDMTRINQLRHKYRKAYEERSGVKLTYMPFIVKATIDALKAFPVLNSSIDGEAVVYKKDINIGLAVALDWGLIVPVIRSADEKNVLGLAKAVSDLAQRARSKKLKVEEVQGGTFTITNPGVFGSLFGTPIINQPQVGILGIGTIEKRPVVRDDAIAIRTMAYLCLTFDHRIVDGSDADKFMGHLKKGLQEFDETGL
jgi:2-oxoglutarate dehydrogenase E2 component (dihydrolipoamide succinyltransferase)